MCSMCGWSVWIHARSDISSVHRTVYGWIRVSRWKHQLFGYPLCRRNVQCNRRGSLHSLYRWQIRLCCRFDDSRLFWCVHGWLRVCGRQCEWHCGSLRQHCSVLSTWVGGAHARS